MSVNRALARRALAGTAASAALLLGAAPFALAQSTEGSAPAATTTSTETSAPATTTTEAPATGSLGAGSLDKLNPEAGKVCELPNLGGSVKALAPFLGIPVPGSILEGATGSLKDIENPLKDSGLNVSAFGSLEGPICTLLGGKMVDGTATSATPTSSSEAPSSTAEATPTTPATTEDVPTGSLGKLNSGSLQNGN